MTEKKKQVSLVTILESLEKYIAKNEDGSIGEHPNITFLRTEEILKELMSQLRQKIVEAEMEYADLAYKNDVISGLVKVHLSTLIGTLEELLGKEEEEILSVSTNEQEA